MTVHVIVPVFNRLALTQAMMSCLRAQETDEPLNVIVVDDGSTDGTGEWLAEQQDIQVLKGNGQLFWGGAVNLALKQILEENPSTDWLLLMNNDTLVDPRFVQTLLSTAQAHRPAAIGSVIRDQRDPSRVLSAGTRINASQITVNDALLDSPPPWPNDAVIEVDALSGRGTLFPLAEVRAAGGMRPRLLPHYFADYELSFRVRRAGCRLLVATGAAVLSEDDYGSQRRFSSILDRFLSIRSPYFAPALVTFWWEASNWTQRLMLPLRLPLFMLWPRLRKAAP